MCSSDLVRTLNRKLPRRLIHQAAVLDGGQIVQSLPHCDFLVEHRVFDQIRGLKGIETESTKNSTVSQWALVSRAFACQECSISSESRGDFTPHRKHPSGFAFALPVRIDVSVVDCSSEHQAATPAAERHQRQSGADQERAAKTQGAGHVNPPSKSGAGRRGSVVRSPCRTRKTPRPARLTPEPWWATGYQSRPSPVATRPTTHWRWSRCKHPRRQSSELGVPAVPDRDPAPGPQSRANVTNTVMSASSRARITIPHPPWARAVCSIARSTGRPSDRVCVAPLFSITRAGGGDARSGKYFDTKRLASSTSPDSEILLPCR